MMPFCIFADSPIRGSGRAINFNAAWALFPTLRIRPAVVACAAICITPAHTQQVNDAEQNTVENVSTATTPVASVEAISAGSMEMAAEGAEELAVDSVDSGKPEKGELIFKTSVGFLYDDNIFQEETELTDDIVALAKIGAEIGSRKSGNGSFLFEYNAIGYTYIDNSELNGINHFSSLQAALDLPKTKLGAVFNYNRVSSGATQLFGQLSGGGTRSTTAEREGAQFADQDVINAGITARRDLSSKIVLNSKLSYNANFLEGDFLSSERMEGRLGLGYRATARSMIGLDGVYGVLNADTNPRQKYQNALVWFEYDPAGKLEFLGDAGVETRQDDGGNGGDDTSSFIFHVKSRYTLRDRTSISLSAGRYTEGAASLSGTTVQHTLISTALDQDIGRKFHLTLEGGYDASDFTRNLKQNSTQTNSEWDGSYWFGRIGLNYKPNHRSSVGLFYEHRNSDSEKEEGFSYQGNRVGIQLAIIF